MWMYCFVVLCGCAVMQVMAVLDAVCTRYSTLELSCYLSWLLSGHDSANTVS